MGSDEKNQFVKKIKADDEYVKKLVTDFGYAKEQLSKVGLDIDKEMHSQIQQSVRTLNKASSVVGGEGPSGKPKIEIFVGVRGSY